VLVRSTAGSSNNLLIGDSTNQCFSLKAGRACIIPCHNVSKVYSKRVSLPGGKVHAKWLGVERADCVKLGIAGSAALVAEQLFEDADGDRE
jgi:hypothetical protein